MSEIKVNKITPRTACGTTTLGDSGDTFTIPSGVTISNLGTAAGFGGTGEISWDTTVKTNSDSGFTATDGVGYFLNTTSGLITVNLPAGTAGASVAFADYAGTFQTYAVTVSPNGTDKIGGNNDNAVLTTEGQSVTFVYVDGVEGWVNVLDSTSNVRGASFITATGGCITTCGNYKMHTFNSPATFCVSGLSPVPGNNVVDYVVVAGGGGGGQAAPMPYSAGGGGGAGGYRESVPNPAAWTGSPLANPGNARPVSVQGYPIIVGGGGAVNVSGDVSTFSDITSAGGGRGGYGPSDPTVPGVAGGSGGGGTYNSPPSPVPTCGGAGNTPPVSPPQGNAGGNANTINGAGAGGGGATAVAGNTGSPSSPDGGAGATSCISASPVARAGGGGGGNDTPTKQGSGGAGGGGTGGSPSTGGGATAGSVNTGGGGGGSGNANPCTGGAGGSGVVILRYKYQ